MYNLTKNAEEKKRKKERKKEKKRKEKKRIVAYLYWASRLVTLIFVFTGYVPAKKRN